MEFSSERDATNKLGASPILSTIFKLFGLIYINGYKKKNRIKI